MSNPWLSPSPLYYPNQESAAAGGAPSGAAGGSLAGTYPNPSLAATAVGAGTYPPGSGFTVGTDGRLTAAVVAGSGGTSTAAPSNGSQLITAAQVYGAGVSGVAVNSGDTILTQVNGTNVLQPYVPAGLGLLTWLQANQTTSADTSGGVTIATLTVPTGSQAMATVYVVARKTGASDSSAFMYQAAYVNVANVLTEIPPGFYNITAYRTGSHSPGANVSRTIAGNVVTFKFTGPAESTVIKYKLDVLGMN